jgi:hypothetical protein
LGSTDTGVDDIDILLNIILLYDVQIAAVNAVKAQVELFQTSVADITRDLGIVGLGPMLVHDELSSFVFAFSHAN